MKTVERVCNRGRNIAGVIKRITRCTSFASRARDRWLGASFTRLNEIERVIDTQDAQLTPCFFTQQSTNEQKGWDERGID